MNKEPSAVRYSKTKARKVKKRPNRDWTSKKHQGCSLLVPYLEPVN